MFKNTLKIATLGSMLLIICSTQAYASGKAGKYKFYSHAGLEERAACDYERRKKRVENDEPSLIQSINDDADAMVDSVTGRSFSHESYYQHDAYVRNSTSGRNLKAVYREDNDVLSEHEDAICSKSQLVHQNGRPARYVGSPVIRR